MVRYKSIFLLSLMILFIACEKDNTSNEEMPGQIPGMGDAGGELLVSEPIVLPAGISLTASIIGVDNPTPFTEQESPLKSSDYPQVTMGSGGEWIALELLFNNATDVNKEVVIPAGCVFEAQDGEYQHGILLQNVRIHVLGNNQLQLKLYLFCINKGKNGSSSVVTYVMKGVSTSEWMAKLTEALAYKNIDISGFTEEEIEEYNLIVNAIQDIVWGITNGDGINDRDWEFINGLRDIITAGTSS